MAEKGVGRWSCFIGLLCLFLTKNDAKTLKFKKSDLYPVVLVPGDGGSQFEAKLDKPTVPHVWCSKKTDYWFSLWLNIELLAPYVLECTVDNLRLQYDHKTRTTSNSPGVQIRVPGFGNSSSVEWLDPSQFGPTAYFNPIVKTLVSMGYERNVNIKGAPYDFRKAANELGEFMADLKKLIETTYVENGNKPSILIGHSMGNMCLLYMLNHQTQSWKNKYVRSFVSLAGPWGGAAKTLRLMASGDNLGVFVVNPLEARPEQRSMPSTAWLLPNATFWPEDEVIVYAPEYNYTIKDYKKFFTDIDYPEGYMMRQDTENLVRDLPAPGVEVFCLHGVNVSTPAKFKYTNKTWYSEQPDVINSDGDGTVNLRSLHGCLRWQAQQKQPIHHQTFKGVDHMAILQQDAVLSYIKSVISTLHGKRSKSKYIY